MYDKYQSLYAALRKSKDMALAKMREGGSLRYMLLWMRAELEEIEKVFGNDPWSKGFRGRSTLQVIDWRRGRGYIVVIHPHQSGAISNSQAFNA